MNCCICNKEINILNSKKSNNNHICNECYNHLPQLVKEKINNYMHYELSSYIEYDKLYHNDLIDILLKLVVLVR